MAKDAVKPTYRRFMCSGLVQFVDVVSWTATAICMYIYIHTYSCIRVNNPISTYIDLIIHIHILMYWFMYFQKLQNTLKAPSPTVTPPDPSSPRLAVQRGVRQQPGQRRGDLNRTIRRAQAELIYFRGTKDRIL